jgi:hypothetical protein
MEESVIRISIGRFDPPNSKAVKQALEATYDKLVPGIKSMTGNRSFCAGIDERNFAMVNVSVWDSLTAAKQMETFQPMLDLAREFTSMGVRFERPILNFERVWTIER